MRALKSLLDEMVRDGFIRRADNGSGLYIYNYSERAQYDKVWNEATLAARGLITTYEGEVVARPFKKFFNHFEVSLNRTEFTGMVEVTEKIDGSLGILYWDEVKGRDLIATRGSFTSEQAVKGSEIFQERYDGKFERVREWTYLFEIVYPGNRVIVDYNGIEDLILLGAVETATGNSVRVSEIEWPGLKAEVHNYKSFEEALKAPQRGGVEGVVVHFIESNERVKIKEEAYMRLHSLLSDLSERRVWEVLSGGGEIEELMKGMPEEVRMLVNRWASELRDQYSKEIESYRSCFKIISAEIELSGDARSDRGRFAERVSRIEERNLRSAMFLLLDGGSVEQLAWRSVKPEEHTPVQGIRGFKG